MLETLEIEFSNTEALNHFKTWLCESGEQDYFMWMEVRESEEDGPISAIKFNYHNGDGDTATEKFNASRKITTTCGRFTK